MSVDIKNLSWEVNSKKILDDISLSISSGEIITILGPNGAGKSSFLKIISGDLKCTEGQIYFDQSNLDDISIQDRSFIRSVMSQSQDVVYDFSTREIIEMGWLDRGISNYSEDFKKAIDQISEDCSVKNLLEQSFNTLSGGEKRRVHFARTLIQLWRPSGSDDPRYMFLDEPTANLDILHEQKMMKLIQKKRDEGLGILLILHDLNLAAKYSDQIALFDNGKLIDKGLPKTVLTEDTLSAVYGLKMNVEKNPFRINYY
jgi:iron complex transport system ATP-binding protein